MSAELMKLVTQLRAIMAELEVLAAHQAGLRRLVEAGEETAIALRDRAREMTIAITKLQSKLEVEQDGKRQRPKKSGRRREAK